MREKLIKLIKFLVYAIIILIPLVYFKTGMYPFQVIKTTLFQSFTEIIFAAWLALAIFYKEYRPRWTPILIGLTIFIGVLSLSSIFGSDWRMSLWSDESRTLGLVALFHFFGLYLTLTSLKYEMEWKKIWTASFGAATLVSLVAIAQKFQIIPHSFAPIYQAENSRTGSTLGNPAFMAGYLLPNLFIGLWQIISGLKEFIFREKAIWLRIIGVALVLIAILLSQTMATLLGMTVGVLFLLVYFSISNYRGKRVSIFLLTALIVFLAGFFLTRNNLVWEKIPGFSRVANVSLAQDSVRDRITVWKISVKAFKDNPLLGWGFENFRLAYDKHYDPSILVGQINGTYWDKPHNIFLEYLIVAGAIGLAGYLILILSAAYSLRIIQKRGDKDLIAPFFGAIMIAYLVQNFFIFDTIGPYLMFFLLLSYIDSRVGDEHSAREKKNVLEPGNLKYAASIFIGIALIGLYFNYQIFLASTYEYWAVNYFLNALPENSLVSYSQALTTDTPYMDDINKTFANVVKQAAQQGIVYPRISDLQAKIVKELKNVIDKHPYNYFNYVVLGEFENNFYQYDKSYIKEAEELGNKAFELSPERQQIFYLLAKTKLLQGDTKAAYDIFQKAVELNPDSGDPHFYFGLMAYGLGDFKKASEEFALAEKLGRSIQKAQEATILGDFEGDHNHNYQKAINYYIMAASLAQKERNFSRPNALLKLAIAYYFNKDFANSRAVFIELKKGVDLTTLPIYLQLKPVLEELGVK